MNHLREALRHQLLRTSNRKKVGTEGTSKLESVTFYTQC